MRIEVVKVEEVEVHGASKSWTMLKFKCSPGMHFFVRPFVSEGKDAVCMTRCVKAWVELRGHFPDKWTGPAQVQKRHGHFEVWPLVQEA
jgi:hypothetical protein